MEEQIWQSLLDLKVWVAARKDTADLVYLSENGGFWSWEDEIDSAVSPILVVSQRSISVNNFQHSAILIRKNLYSFQAISNGNWSPTDLQFYCEYIAYVFLKWEAIRQNRAITVSHFAQSLDGRIATLSGDSKWIGSEANLIHAHRMRALCEGILIGSRTLKMDQPALTVRHVKGQNPQRIVLGSSKDGDFESLKKSCPDIVWAIGKTIGKKEEGVKYISLETELSGNAACEGLLQWLYKNEIHTIYIEGGAQTTSYFLIENMIDILQLHFSPQLFGSGISSIQLPEIQKVTDSIQFDPFDFLQIGKSVMFVGIPQKNSQN